MINYVVASDVERFVRFTFGHTSLRSTAPPYMALLFGEQSIRRCAVPTGWFSELILPGLSFRRRRWTARDQLIRPGTRSMADSGAVRQDLRSKINRATGSATSRQSTSSIPHGPYQLLGARGPGC